MCSDHYYSDEGIKSVKIRDKKWIKLKYLGKGSYGTVFLAID